MKWVRLTEVYSWWPYDEEPYKGHPSHSYAKIPDALCDRLADAAQALDVVQDEVNKYLAQRNKG